VKKLLQILGIAIVLFVGVAHLAAPKLIPASDRFESSAISTLRTLSSAQSAFQAMCAVDTDGDGVGEFGFFGELAGRVAMRGTDETLDPMLLSPTYDRISADALGDGVLIRQGYVFKLFLPTEETAGVRGVAETPDGWPDHPALDADEGEQRFCIYAWPVTFGVGGERAFFLDQAGDILQLRNARGFFRKEPIYTGTDDGTRIPAFDAVYSTSGDMRSPLGLHPLESVDRAGWDTESGQNPTAKP